MRNDSALGIIFRVPEYGRVKKRLAQEIGPEDALKAYSAMLHETLENVSRLTVINIYGFYDGSLSPQNKLLNKLPCIPQIGKDLGERMLNAINWLFDKGFKRVVLIGADSPDLPVRFIEDAFLILNNYELVIGPSEDGGYYLIGMSKPLDAIFQDISWGSRDVLEKTISTAEKEGIKHLLLPEWYDIDDIEGLRQWKSKQNKCLNE